MTVGAWLGVGAAFLGLSLGCAWRAPRLWLGLVLGGLGAGLAAAVRVLVTGETWVWRGAFAVGGEVAQARLDGLSALFLALLAVGGGAGAVYAREYWPDRAHPRSAPAGRWWWSALLLSMGLVLASSNGLHFLVAWELFALSGFFLITLEGRRREVRAAGWLYLAASHAGTLALFGLFAGWAAWTGSWDLGPRRELSQLAPLFWLALFGFGVKAGLFPLHIWLPSAHANAPSHVSAMLSGVAIKLGIYGLVRFGSWLPTPAGGGEVVVALGVGSAVLGVAFALGQHDLKRLLAYHSVENIGIILIGLGFALLAAGRGEAGWGAVALAGALLHVWNHGLFKSLLFLAAGAVVHATGVREMSRLGGLWRGMPWTAGLFALGSVAIAGLPPLNGFVSEWLMYLGLFTAMNEAGPGAWLAVAAILLLAMTGALALACFVKVCGVVFLGAPRSAAAERGHEAGWWMRGPMLVLGAGCVGIGLAPVIFWRAVQAGVGAWWGDWSEVPPPASLGVLGLVHGLLVVAAVLGSGWLWRHVHRTGWVREGTWDCGFAAPTPRMQYTAGSFAGILTGWFGWVLRPERRGERPKGLFPRGSAWEEHTPETVLERGIEPVARVVLGVSRWVRGLQHGRTHAYVLYLMFGLAALAVLALVGGP